MKVIVPHEIDLIETNVLADPAEEWDRTTTYGVGDIRKVTAGLLMPGSLEMLPDLLMFAAPTPHTVYKSLRPNNLNRFPADYLEPVVEEGTSATSIVVTGAASIVTGTSATTVTMAAGQLVFTTQTGKGFAAGQPITIKKTATPISFNMLAEVLSYVTGTGVLTVNVYQVSGTGDHAGWTITAEIPLVGNARTFITQTGKSFFPGQVVEIAKAATPLSVNMTGEVTAYDIATGSMTVEVNSTTGEGTHSAWVIKTKDEKGYWEVVRTTNQWAMWNQYLYEYTENDGEIHFKLRTNRADHSVFYGLDAQILKQIMWNAEQTEILWEDEINLIYSNPLTQPTDWWEYYYGEAGQTNEVMREFGVAPYEGVLEVRIINTASKAKCGDMVLGRAFYLGELELNPEAGIIDYTLPKEEENGRITLKEGYWAKENSLLVRVPAERADAVYKTLASLRATPAPYIGDDEPDGYEAFKLLGIAQRWRIVFHSSKYIGLSIDLKGFV